MGVAARRTAYERNDGPARASPQRPQSRDTIRQWRRRRPKARWRRDLSRSEVALRRGLGRSAVDRSARCHGRRRKRVAEFAASRRPRNDVGGFHHNCLRGQPRAFGERGKLHPHDLGVDLDPAGEGAEAAIDAGDDVLAAGGLARIARCGRRPAPDARRSSRSKSITPGMMVLPSGSLTSCQTFHSWPWRGLAPGNDTAMRLAP